MIYTRENLIQSVLDVQRYCSAEAGLADDMRGFNQALEAAFGTPLREFSSAGFFTETGPQALLFRRGIEAIQAQESGVLEEGLLYLKLEEQGESGKQLLQAYLSVGGAGSEVRRKATELLLQIVAAVWPAAPVQVTSADLLQHGFNDEQRPDPLDFW
ncbi:hypothetical protein [Deinococcus arcticus]|nr:hypothetical protein [Deinococcus arcticus]